MPNFNSTMLYSQTMVVPQKENGMLTSSSQLAIKRLKQAFFFFPPFRLRSMQYKIYWFTMRHLAILMSLSLLKGHRRDHWQHLCGISMDASLLWNWDAFFINCDCYTEKLWNSFHKFGNRIILDRVRKISFLYCSLSL